MRPLLPEQEHLSLDFSTHEIKASCRLLKPGKAFGPFGIHNEFLSCAFVRAYGQEMK